METCNFLHGKVKGAGIWIHWRGCGFNRPSYKCSGTDSWVFTPYEGSIAIGSVCISQMCIIAPCPFPKRAISPVGAVEERIRPTANGRRPPPNPGVGLATHAIAASNQYMGFDPSDVVGKLLIERVLLHKMFFIQALHKALERPRK